jgi:glycosyltransferase involved in cell wall biosynthesis
VKLFYFTYCYPFGSGEQWKTNELNVLVRHFEEITVIPYFFGGNFNNPKPLPPGVKLAGPLFRDMGVKGKKSDILRILLHRKAPLFLREFLIKKVYREKKHLQSWVGSTLNSIRLLAHPVLKDVIAKGDKNTILYFYWGKGSSEILPFINTSVFNKVFVRMHRFDLFEYVNDDYIPYRKSLLEHVTVAAPVSFAGRDHLVALYPEMAERIKVFRIGTQGNGRRSKKLNDGCLRVISCSGLSPVKRVDIMIRSLEHVKFPIIWHHIGNGSLDKELRLLAEKLRVTDKFIFEGVMDSGHVMDFFTDHPFDIFVNTSQSEGVPVTIMESFAAGIPAMATDVGGTGELVDGTVGMLLPENIDPSGLADQLKIFFQKPEEEKSRLRENAYRRYEQHWNAGVLAEELAAYLKSAVVN